MTQRVEVTVTHLEMRDPAAMRAPIPAPAGVTMQREPLEHAATVAADLYARVGRDYHWLDRLPWQPAEWRATLAREGAELWTLREGDAIAGYFELAREGDTVEIRYLGLLAPWHGRGLGRYLLDQAVRRAWALHPVRVIVETCTLDGAAALPNYIARGFTVAREERVWRGISA